VALKDVLKTLRQDPETEKFTVLGISTGGAGVDLLLVNELILMESTDWQLLVDRIGMSNYHSLAAKSTDPIALYHLGSSPESPVPVLDTLLSHYTNKVCTLSSPYSEVKDAASTLMVDFVKQPVAFKSLKNTKFRLTGQEQVALASKCQVLELDRCLFSDDGALLFNMFKGPPPLVIETLVIDGSMPFSPVLFRGVIDSIRQIKGDKPKVVLKWGALDAVLSFDIESDNSDDARALVKLLSTGLEVDSDAFDFLHLSVADMMCRPPKGNKEGRLKYTFENGKTKLAKVPVRASVKKYRCTSCAKGFNCTKHIIPESL
jgi:hypothetical protein